MGAEEKKFHAGTRRTFSQGPVTWEDLALDLKHKDLECAGDRSVRRRRRKRWRRRRRWRPGAGLTPELLERLPAWAQSAILSSFPSIITACYPS